MRSSGAHCSVVLSLLSASLLAVFGFSSSVEAQAPAGASADLGTVEGAAKLAASAGAAPADVLGIKLGIQAKDVLPLVKAANAKYQIKQNYACQSGSGCDK